VIKQAISISKPNLKIKIGKKKNIFRFQLEHNLKTQLLNEDWRIDLQEFKLPWMKLPWMKKQKKRAKKVKKKMKSLPRKEKEFYKFLNSEKL